MLIEHASTQAIAIGLRGRISSQVMKHAKKSGMRIKPGCGFLSLPVAASQGRELRRDVFKRVFGILKLVLDVFEDPIAARRMRRDHDIVGRGDFGKRSIVAVPVEGRRDKRPPASTPRVLVQLPAGC